MAELKAYVVRDKNSFYSTVVFAESKNQARYIATHTEVCEDVPYADIRAYRISALDKHYRGLKEMDWYNDADRIAMVKDGGYSCLDAPYECKSCPAKEYCNVYEEGDAE